MNAYLRSARVALQHGFVRGGSLRFGLNLPRASATLIFWLAQLASGCGSSTINQETTTATEHINYRGWENAIRLQNEHVEAIIVPKIGRVMSFRFREGENVFWEDRSLAGQQGDTSGKAWINFGGDRAWPAPEAEWSMYTKRSTWMPPPGFDGMPWTARIENDAVIMTSLVDPFYGVRTVRRVTLRGNAPAMDIETTFERVAGNPARIAIWIITQFKRAGTIYLPIPGDTKFREGHFLFRDGPWPQLTVNGGLIRITHDPAARHKMGSDADRMLWIGEDAMCLISSPRVPNADYPDRGASTEVYTNPEPHAFVELETLGPLSLMKRGSSFTRTNSYTLLRRTGSDSEVEARRILDSSANTAGGFLRPD